MDNLFHKTIVTTILITLSIGNLTAHAHQIWSGKGEIIEGDNQGASVQLKIETDNSGNAKILSQPTPDRTIPLQSRTKTSIGIWEIYPCDGDMCVTFEQKYPYRIVYYRLERQ